MKSTQEMLCIELQLWPLYFMDVMEFFDLRGNSALWSIENCFSTVQYSVYI